MEQPEDDVKADPKGAIAFAIVSIFYLIGERSDRKYITSAANNQLTTLHLSHLIQVYITHGMEQTIYTAQ